MRNPAVDIDIDEIESSMANAQCSCVPIVPVDLILCHVPGRFVAYVWDSAGRFLMVDTRKLEYDTEVTH